jgi:hypothetical protein
MVSINILSFTDKSDLPGISELSHRKTNPLIINYIQTLPMATNINLHSFKFVKTDRFIPLKYLKNTRCFKFK